MRLLPRLCAIAALAAIAACQTAPPPPPPMKPVPQAPVAANPLEAALGGILAEQTTVRISLLIMASGVALSLLLSWFSPLWQVQTPQGVEQEETLV